MTCLPTPYEGRYCPALPKRTQFLMSSLAQLCVQVASQLAMMQNDSGTSPPSSLCGPVPFFRLLGISSVSTRVDDRWGLADMSSIRVEPEDWESRSSIVSYAQHALFAFQSAVSSRLQRRTYVVRTVASYVSTEETRRISWSWL